MKDMQLFMDKILLPAEGQEELKKQLQLLTENGMTAKINDTAKHFFADKTKSNYDASLEQMRSIAAHCGISAYTVEFLYMMTCGELLLEEYQAEGLSEDLFWETMYDLHCKFDECWNMYHVWGTFVSFWYYGFWTHKIFKLGRLEYEISEVETEPYQKNGICLKKGDTVYSVHIPSAGPLRPEEVTASLKKAHRFFGCKAGEILPCVCYSWLLYPTNAQVFPQDSNLKKFFDLFDIVDSEADENFSDCWRVFYQDLNGNPAALRAESTLQKNIVRWLMDGNSMGEGTAYLLFDGENVVSR